MLNYNERDLFMTLSFHTIKTYLYNYVKQDNLGKPKPLQGKYRGKLWASITVPAPITDSYRMWGVRFS